VNRNGYRNGNHYEISEWTASPVRGVASGDVQMNCVLIETDELKVHATPPAGFAPAPSSASASVY